MSASCASNTKQSSTFIGGCSANGLAVSVGLVELYRDQLQP